MENGWRGEKAISRGRGTVMDNLQPPLSQVISGGATA